MHNEELARTMAEDMGTPWLFRARCPLGVAFSSPSPTSLATPCLWPFPCHLLKFHLVLGRAAHPRLLFLCIWCSAQPSAALLAVPSFLFSLFVSYLVKHPGELFGFVLKHKWPKFSLWTVQDPLLITCACDIFFFFNGFLYQFPRVAVIVPHTEWFK